jgi:hypothetical protein
MMQWGDDDEAIREEEENAYAADRHEFDDSHGGYDDTTYDDYDEDDDVERDPRAISARRGVSDSGSDRIDEEPLHYREGGPSRNSNTDGGAMADDDDHKTVMSPRLLHVAPPSAPSPSRQILASQESGMLEQHMRSVLQSHVIAQTELATMATLRSLSSDETAAALCRLVLDPSEGESANTQGTAQPWEPRPNDTFVSPLVRLVAAITKQSMHQEWLQERVLGELSRLGVVGECASRLLEIVVAVHPEKGDNVTPTGIVEEVDDDDDDAVSEEALLRERMLRNPLLRIRADGVIDPEVSGMEDDEAARALALASKKKSSTKRSPKSDSGDGSATIGEEQVDEAANMCILTFEQFFASLVDPQAVLAPGPLSDDVVFHLQEVECAARYAVMADEDTTRLTDDADVVLITECDEAFDDAVSNWRAVNLPAPIPAELEEERRQINEDIAALRDANADADRLATELRAQLDNRRKQFDAKVATRREASVVLDAVQMREALRQCRAIESELAAMDASTIQIKIRKEVEMHVQPLTRQLVDNDDIIRNLMGQIECLESVGRNSGLWALAHAGGNRYPRTPPHQRYDEDPYQTMPPHQQQPRNPYSDGVVASNAYRRQDENVFLASIKRVPQR